MSEETPITGVCSLNDVDIEQVLFMKEYDPELEEHFDTCPHCKEGDLCDLDGHSPEVAYYSDKPWQKGPDGLWETKEASLVLKVNYDVATVQVILSPCTERHGKASPCYPCQADLDAEGDLLCYALPPDCRAEG